MTTYTTKLSETLLQCIPNLLFRDGSIGTIYRHLWSQEYFDGKMLLPILLSLYTDTILDSYWDVSGSKYIWIYFVNHKRIILGTQPHNGLLYCCFRCLHSLTIVFYSSKSLVMGELSRK